MALDFQENYPLSQLTTFNIGGFAKFFTEIHNESEVFEAINFSKEKALPIFVIGGGSNILISDQGFLGLAVLNRILGMEFKDNDEVSIDIGAGENWDGVVSKCVELGYSGIESLSGVPGTVGGAVVQNIGAYGQTISDSIEEVSTIDIKSGEYVVFNNRECEFTYRDSLFKQTFGKYLVTKVRLKLKKDKQVLVDYKDLKKYFKGKEFVSVLELREAVIQIRDSKGYLIMRGFGGYKTAGSFFKNPVITKEEFEKIKDQLPEPDDTETSKWFWDHPQGFKIATARLLQKAGFKKGYSEGRVGISPKHALSIINLGGASAKEVYEFAQKIKQTVFKKFGIMLTEEILYIGEFK